MTATVQQKKCSLHTGCLPEVHMSAHPPSLLSSCSKMPLKGGRTGPSPLRQLLPIAACLLAFATVLSILIVYMDTTAIRHQQFRLNMSRDYDMKGVRQDDPTLVTFIREIQLKKYPMPYMKDSPGVGHLNFTERHELAPVLAETMARLVGMKQNGVFVQSMPASAGSLMTAAWLAETLNWGGTIVEPEPRKYFALRKDSAHRPNVQIVHACVSPTGYPKEVTLHHDEENEVKINSLLDEEVASFNSRVKCFPLYTLMLAVNHTSVDVLSLGVQGQELQILETVPFDKILIRIISVHLHDYYQHEDEALANEYTQNVTRFLQSKSYKLVKRIDYNYIYQLNRFAH